MSAQNSKILYPPSLWGYNDFCGNSPLLRSPTKTFEEHHLKRSSQNIETTQENLVWNNIRKNRYEQKSASNSETISESDSSLSTNSDDVSQLSGADGMYLSKKKKLSKKYNRDLTIYQNRLNNLEGKYNRILKYFNLCSKKSKNGKRLQEFRILNSTPTIDKSKAAGNSDSEDLFETVDSWSDNSENSYIHMKTFRLNGQDFQDLYFPNEKDNIDNVSLKNESFKAICPGTSPIFHCLRMLSALEEQLGSLGPKVLELLAKVINFGKMGIKEPMTLLYERDVYLFFEIVKEKIKGQLFAGVVKEYLVKACISVVYDIDCMLCAYPLINKDVYSVGKYFNDDLSHNSEHGSNISYCSNNKYKSVIERDQLHPPEIVNKLSHINVLLNNIVSTAYKGFDALNEVCSKGVPKIEEASLSTSDHSALGTGKNNNNQLISSAFDHKSHSSLLKYSEQEKNKQPKNYSQNKKPQKKIKKSGLKKKNGKLKVGSHRRSLAKLEEKDSRDGYRRDMRKRSGHTYGSAQPPTLQSASYSYSAPHLPFTQSKYYYYDYRPRNYYSSYFY